MRKKLHVVLTCEHAGNEVPSPYKPLFRGQMALLRSHRGYDPGALELARRFAKKFKLPLFYTKISRLLVEPNRSLHHPKLFSEISRQLDRDEREKVLKKYYFSHRDRIEKHISQLIKRGHTVVHLGVHTFTPKLNGSVRHADIGLLYTPKRPGDRKFSLLWQEQLEQASKDYKVRRNYPYRGSSDGFIPYLCKTLNNPKYVGVEIEVNQCHFTTRRKNNKVLQQIVVETFARTLEQFSQKN